MSRPAKVRRPPIVAMQPHGPARRSVVGPKHRLAAMQGLGPPLGPASLNLSGHGRAPGPFAAFPSRRPCRRPARPPDARRQGRAAGLREPRSRPRGRGQPDGSGHVPGAPRPDRPLADPDQALRKPVELRPDRLVRESRPSGHPQPWSTRRHPSLRSVRATMRAGHDGQATAAKPRSLPRTFRPPSPRTCLRDSLRLSGRLPSQASDEEPPLTRQPAFRLGRPRRPSARPPALRQCHPRHPPKLRHPLPQRSILPPAGRFAPRPPPPRR